MYGQSSDKVKRIKNTTVSYHYIANTIDRVQKYQDE